MNTAKSLNNILKTVQTYVHQRNSKNVDKARRHLTQMSEDDRLPFTPGQRGALNYYGNPNNPWDKETLQILRRILQSIEFPPKYEIKASFAPSVSDLIVEPVITRSPHGYRWTLLDCDGHEIIVDQRTYKTLKETQLYADKFLKLLSRPDSKKGCECWLKLGIQQWLDTQRTNGCQVQVLQIRDRSYLIIKEDLKNTVKDRTEYYSKKIADNVPEVFPLWSARGYINPSGYFWAFSFRSKTLQIDISQLQKIICNNTNE